MAKSVLLKYHLIDAESMGADITSAVTDIRFMDNIAIQINFTTSDAVGTFYVQGSVDHNVQDPMNSVESPSGNWVDLDLSPTPTAASANDNILINLTQMSFPFIRVFYDRTSGTGTCDAYIFGKSIS